MEPAVASLAGDGATRCDLVDGIIGIIESVESVIRSRHTTQLLVSTVSALASAMLASPFALASAGLGLGLSAGACCGAFEVFGAFEDVLEEERLPRLRVLPRSNTMPFLGSTNRRWHLAAVAANTNTHTHGGERERERETD